MRINTEKLLNIAHRGDRALAPENTLVAGRRAYDSGADMWEFDVQLTADKEFVVIHDSTLDRTTNAEKIFPDWPDYRVSNFELSKIKSLDAGSWFEKKDPFERINQGRVSSEELESYREEKIPTLREALELTAKLDWCANIELKLSEEQIASVDKPFANLLQRLVDMVEELDLAGNIMVSSFNHGLVRELNELDPKLTGALLARELGSHPLEYIKANNVKTLNLHGSAVESHQGQDRVKDIHDAGRGYKVNVWTINAREKMKELIAKPFINGLITDYPGRLARIIAQLD